MEGGQVLITDLIVTNNQRVADHYAHHAWVDGSYLEVMIKVRDLLYQGHYRLINHPLPASSRMFLTPVRSIVLRSSELDMESIIIIQESIDSYQKIMQAKQPDLTHLEDYQFIDWNQLQQALIEQERMDRLVEESLKP